MAPSTCDDLDQMGRFDFNTKTPNLSQKLYFWKIFGIFILNVTDENIFND